MASEVRNPPPAPPGRGANLVTIALLHDSRNEVTKFRDSGGLALPAVAKGEGWGWVITGTK